MRAALRLATLLMACGLAACAVGPDTSYVSSLSAPADASVIAAGIASFMQTQLPAASTTLILDPTPSDQWASNVLTPALASSLRQKGFGVVQGTAPSGAHTLRYWVTAFDASR